MLRPGLMNWEAERRGGWGVVYVPPERAGVSISADQLQPHRVVDEIVRWRMNNGLEPDVAGVWAFCNGEWCRRAPHRCPAGANVVAAGMGRRTLTPIDYGPWAWQWLNTFGVTFDAALFRAAIAHTRALLNPALREANYFSGCAVCHDHFLNSLAEYPPARVSTREEAAVWVWTVHDLANAHARKPKRPTFFEIAIRYGWEPLAQDRVIAIQARLRSEGRSQRAEVRERRTAGRGQTYSSRLGHSLAPPMSIRSRPPSCPPENRSALYRASRGIG